MDRIVAPQPREPVGPDVVLEETRIRDVDLINRDRPGVA